MYSTVEAGLLATLRGTTGFTDRSVDTRSTILAEGVECACVVRYAGFRREEFAFDGAPRYRWMIDVDLFVKWVDEDQVWDATTTARDAVLERLDQYHKLNGTEGVLNSVSLSGRPNLVPIELGSHKFYKETISLEVSELVEYESAEE